MKDIMDTIALKKIQALSHLPNFLQDSERADVTRTQFLRGPFYREALGIKIHWIFRLLFEVRLEVVISLCLIFLDCLLKVRIELLLEILKLLK